MITNIGIAIAPISQPQIKMANLSGTIPRGVVGSCLLELSVKSLLLSLATKFEVLLIILTSEKYPMYWEKLSV
jgi:hypothetical protein